MSESRPLVPRVSPETQVDNNRSVAEQIAEENERHLNQVLDEGLGPFGVQTSAQKLQGFYDSTLKDDIPLVTDPDYKRKWLAGDMPDLRAWTLYQEWKAAVSAQEQETYTAQMEQRPPVIGELPIKPPLFWCLILELPEFVFRRLSAEFGRLYRG